jgi:hypothetical protein
MRGVRLNAAKTQVLSASAARRFFHQKENEYLDRMKTLIETAQNTGKSTKSIETRLSKSFVKFAARRPHGHCEKIIKRYIGHFHMLESDAALEYALEHFEDSPGLRDTVYRYIASLPPTTKTLAAITRYFFGGGALDDASQCQLAIVLTEWEVQPGTALFRSLRKLSERMTNAAHIGREPFRFLSALWMITKYSTQKRLKDFIEEFCDVWQHSEFLSRQVTAASGKFRNPQLISWFGKQLERHSFRSALSVLSALNTLRSYSAAVPSDVRLYVLNGNNKTTYSLQRFLVAVAILSSKNLNAKPKLDLKQALLKILRDPHYVKVVTAL